MAETPRKHAPESYKGKLLLATPDMNDPRFQRAVIYICGHDESGAMGIMINKAKNNFMTSQLLQHIGIEGDLRIPDSVVLFGGPVEDDRGFVLHSTDYFRADSSLKLSSTLAMTSTKDILNALVTDYAPQRARLAIGYAGWDGGQLEAELAQNAWLISQADDALIFDEDLPNKWSQAIRAMGIDPAALAASGGQA